MVRTCEVAVAFTLVVLGVVSASVSNTRQIRKGPKERRAPSGFVGMRGKKDVMPNEDWNWENFELQTDYERDKKAPSGFMGMRGKKAPSNFIGMRGKKNDEEDLEIVLHSPLLEELSEEQLRDLLKRAPSNFMGMRGKKAPSGFVGMRGKKYFDTPEETLASLEEVKRAPSGFMGMRGKKYEQLIDDVTNEEKRAPNGFVGMRG